MMKGSDIGIQEKKAKLFNEWEWFTSTKGESIESYYHRFSKLMNDFKRNKHFPKNIVSNLKFLNNLQPEWSRHVTIVHQTKDLHTKNYTQLYDFLKYNQKEVDELKAERLARTHDPLALMANSNNPYNYPVFQQDQPLPMVRGNGENQFRQYAGQNVENPIVQNAVQNLGVQNVGNQNGLIVVPGIVNPNANQNGNGNVVTARAEGNAIRNNVNLIRCYNYRGLDHLARNCTVRPRRRDAAYLQLPLKGLSACRPRRGYQHAEMVDARSLPHVHIYPQRFCRHMVEYPKEILATEKAARSFEPPPKMFESKRSQDLSKYCHFHEDYRHDTNDCRYLKTQIQEAVNSGQLSHLVKGIKKSRNPYRKKSRTRNTDYGGKEIIFPPVARVNNVPVIIEAKIFGRKKLNPTIKATKVDQKTPLVGFLGEHSWSDSPYNMLLGRTAMQRMGIVVSKIHGAIKFHTEKGIRTVLSTDEANEGTKRARKIPAISKERVLSCVNAEEKIIVNDKYSNQTVTIEKQLPDHFNAKPPKVKSRRLRMDTR
ncbi:hypothetical protein Tco_0690375 [Tanacetum coccineum]